MPQVGRVTELGFRDGANPTCCTGQRDWRHASMLGDPPIVTSLHPERGVSSGRGRHRGQAASITAVCKHDHTQTSP